MATLLQISDPHFGTEQPPVATALLRLAHRLQPEVIVLSGDITQRARRAQFAAAKAYTEQLPPARLLAIPGNHDIPLINLMARVFHPYANFRRAFGRELEPNYSSDGFLIVCVNTTRPQRHKDGEVSAQQIADVAARLRAAQNEQLRVVVVHQPVHVVREEDAENLLHGHDAAVRAWSSAGADLILGGHIHLPYSCDLKAAVPNLRRHVWIAQAGTAISHRVRHEAPNSVNVVRHSGNQTCELERWDYDTTRGEFSCVEVKTIGLDRG